MVALEKELMDSLAALDADQRRQVLEYARALGDAPGRGIPGRALLRFAGTMSDEDVRTIRAAVEEDCERIDPRDW